MIWVVNLWVYLAYFRVVILHIRNTGTIPNPAFPKSLNDKFLWRKIFDHNPDFMPLSDKLESQAIARKKCPGVRVPKTLWVGSRASDVPGELLTGNVVVKASHGSGFVIPVFNGKYDRCSLEKKIARWMCRTYGRRHWEWGYFALKPKLYIEEMMLDEYGGYGTTELKVYVYCGKMEMIVVIYDRQIEPTAAVFRGDWSRSVEENKIGLPRTQRALPSNLRQIENVALMLCNGFDHARVDLYVVKDQIWFGEYTLYNQGGYIKIGTDKQLIDSQTQAWDIRKSWFLKQEHTGIRGWYAKSLLKMIQDR